MASYVMAMLPLKKYNHVFAGYTYRGKSNSSVFTLKSPIKLKQQEVGD